MVKGGKNGVNPVFLAGKHGIFEDAPAARRRKFHHENHGSRSLSFRIYDKIGCRGSDPGLIGQSPAEGRVSLSR